MTEQTACIFCRILENREKASFVAQGSDAVAFLDIHPVNEGHTLVIPRRQQPRSAEVTGAAPARCGRLARPAAARPGAPARLAEASTPFLPAAPAPAQG